MSLRDFESSPNGARGGFGGNTSLKKHKILPHPRRNGSSDYSTPSSNANSSSASRGLSLETDVTSPSSINASPRTLKHTSRRIIGSVDLPPTPPAHSRNSSNDTSIPLQVVINGDLVESPACSTPINVQSPPTPDFTPPRPRRAEAVQPKQGAVRREMGSRNDSINTTTSFVTAKEELGSDQDGSSTMRPDVSSPVDGMDFREDDERTTPQPPHKMRSLGLGLEVLEDAFAGQNTPAKDGTPLRKTFSFEHNFDEEFTPDTPTRDTRGVENPILSRNVTITRGKARRKPYNFDNEQTPTKQLKQEHRRRHTEQELLLRDGLTVKTPNAIRYIKEHGIDDREEFGRVEVEATPRTSHQEEDMAGSHRRLHTHPANLLAQPRARQDPIVQDSHDVRKFSHSSQRSNSTVEAFVMIQPQELKMRRTLRHKERMGSLRDFSPSHAPRAAMTADLRLPTQRLRHRSVDLPQRNMEDRRVEEKPRRFEEGPVQHRQRKLSDHPLPQRPRDVAEQDPVPVHSRQISEQTVVEQPRKVSDHPLPQRPREVIKQQPAPEFPRQITQAQQPQQPRRYSIERKPVPTRPRIDSTATNDTSASNKSRSRKALLADGIIPVVVVPRRTSSLKEQSAPQSLRSTSTTRNSKVASRSSSAAPLSASAGTNIPGAFPESNPPSVRARRNSDSAATTPKEDGLVRSIDFGPPAIPVRRSSMSAPTTPMGSRNVSRSNSLTADLLRKHNESEALAAIDVVSQLPAGPSVRTVSQTIQQRRDEKRDSGVGYGVGIVSHSVRIEEPELDRENRHRNTYLSVDTNGDPLFGQRLSPQATPFSARSDVTGVSHGTALEVAEARQVDIFSHQNTSVQLVDQEPPSSSASESTKLRNKSINRPRPTTSSSTATRPNLQAGEKYSSTSPENSNFNISGATNNKFPQPTTQITPASPPIQSTHFTDNTVGGDSPLINPRNPPQPPAGPPAGPPAFKIIPPTPAALAAADEASKELGYEFPLDANGDVSRPPRRNWSLRRIGGGLARTLSLTRRNSERGRRTDVMDIDVGGGISAPVIIDDERPAEEGKLHPFWKPANYREEADDDCDCDECCEYWARIENEARSQKRNSGEGQGGDKAVRPGMPRRTTSQISEAGKRLRKTFAILPIAGAETVKGEKEDEGYNVSYATARRTIKRSGSGNLKVVKRVGNVSKESVKLQEYLNLSSRRPRSFRRNRLRENKRKDADTQALGNNTTPQTPPQQRKRFSWVGGSTDSPAGRYPPAVSYQPIVPNEGVFESRAPIKRTFSLPTTKGNVSISFPPRVQIQWPSLGGLGGLTRRFSEKRKEEKREGLRRTISAPRGVRDGVEEVLTRRQRDEARRVRGRMDEGVQIEDFARR